MCYIITMIDTLFTLAAKLRDLILDKLPESNFIEFVVEFLVCAFMCGVFGLVLYVILRFLGL